MLVRRLEKLAKKENKMHGQWLDQERLLDD